LPASGDAVAGVGGCDVVRGGPREALGTGDEVELAFPCAGAPVQADPSVIKTAIANALAK